MDQRRRLSVLEHMLTQLTGKKPAVSQVPAATISPPPDPSQRKLQLLRSMLSKLQGS